MTKINPELEHILSHIDTTNFVNSMGQHGNEFVEALVDGYKTEVKKMSLSHDERSFFTLLTQPLTINVVQLVSFDKTEVCYVSFANMQASKLPSNDYSNSLEAYTFQVSEDDSYVFFSQTDWHDQLKYAISEIKKADSGLSDNMIIPESFNYSVNDMLTSLGDWDQQWTEAEFKKATKTVQSSGFHLEEGVVHFNLSGLHANKYAFNNMLAAIPNEQFHQEVNECLTAYETPLFYVCAAGLSGVIESLLSFTIDNYHFRKKSLPKDPTAYDYLSALSNNGVISSRDLKYLQSTFMLRNSVSHYNSGGVTNELCDRMMSSIQMIFSSIYSTSLAWKNKYSLPSNVTFDQWVKDNPSEAGAWFSTHSTSIHTK